ncbi:ATP-dependent RNA helicase Prp43 [Oopsacas minuta]|uniref:ATP-dependent RNA helicase Prp43 n=1 Tax=Oopsacas minuta TaxID=111878 RepID=A0AAV7JW28_9METZ|nr:ATP-dependent RNA helicase Prp43 [Oopsacas minuta]
MTDNRLSSYDVIILDKVHERRLISDILLGVVKDVLLSRPDVRVIIMSATCSILNSCEFFDKKRFQPYVFDAIKILNSIQGYYLTLQKKAVVLHLLKMFNHVIIAKCFCDIFFNR